MHFNFDLFRHFELIDSIKIRSFYNIVKGTLTRDFSTLLELAQHGDGE